MRICFETLGRKSVLIGAASSSIGMQENSAIPREHSPIDREHSGIQKYSAIIQNDCIVPYAEVAFGNEDEGRSSLMNAKLIGDAKFEEGAKLIEEAVDVVGRKGEKSDKIRGLNLRQQEIGRQQEEEREEGEREEKDEEMGEKEKEGIEFGSVQSVSVLGKRCLEQNEILDQGRQFLGHQEKINVIEQKDKGITLHFENPNKVGGVWKGTTITRPNADQNLSVHQDKDAEKDNSIKRESGESLIIEKVSIEDQDKISDKALTMRDAKKLIREDAKRLIREDAKKVNTNSMGGAKQEQTILSTEVRDQEELGNKDTFLNQEYTGT